MIIFIGKLKLFDGTWQFTPIFKDGEIIGCKCILKQVSMPTFVPPFMSPILQLISMKLSIS